MTANNQSHSNPFYDISIPECDVSLKRTADKVAVHMNWGRDSSGRYIFLIELDGDHRESVKARWVPIKGIEVDLRQLDELRQALVLTLQRESDLDLFTDLCKTLISRLSGAQDSATAVVICLEHVKRWKAFFEGKRAGSLSVEAILGLIGELSFLKEVAAHLGDSSAAVDSWCGPLGSQHDFLISGTAFEIKAAGQASRGVIRISSEDQLDCLAGDLYLRIYRVTESKDEDGVSLNQLVSELDEILGESAMEKLITKLAQVGYVESGKYDTPKFSVRGCKTYAVVEGFPRITKESLPSGILSVSYGLQISVLTEFECDDDPLLKV